MKVIDRRDQVLALYVLGWTYDQMAAELGISRSTIAEYIDRIKESKGIRGRRELVTFARTRFNLRHNNQPGAMTFWEWLDYQAGVTR